MPEGDVETDDDGLPDEQHPEEDEDDCAKPDDVLRARTEILG